MNPADPNNALSSAILTVLRIFDQGEPVRNAGGDADRRYSVHLDIANQPSVLIQMLADRLQRFLSQARLRVEEKAERRDHIERFAERFPRDIDLAQPNIVGDARAGKHRRRHIDAHNLGEVFSRDVRDTACTACEIETLLVTAAQRPQAPFDQRLFDLGPERGVVTRFVGSAVDNSSVRRGMAATVIIAARAFDYQVSSLARRRPGSATPPS